MPQTLDPGELSQYMVDFFRVHQASLNLMKVFYGDQRTIPETPALCIEPGIMEREMAGTTLRLMNDLRIVLYIYNAGLGDNEAVQRECDSLTTAIARRIDHEALPPQAGGTQLGGRIISGFCSRYEYGYAIRGGRMLRANRLTFTGFSKTGMEAP